jgi:transcriptional regulator with XRE-family HTH domain
MLDPNKLRAMIQKRGLTQKEVARRVRKRGGKLSPVKLNHLCNIAKPSDPKLSIIEGIAAVLQCSMMKLLSRKVESADTSRTIVDHIGDVVAEVMTKEAIDPGIAPPAPDAPPVVVEATAGVAESPAAIVIDAPAIIEQPAAVEPQQAVEITTVEPQQAVTITTEPEAVANPPEQQT